MENVFHSDLAEVNKTVTSNRWVAPGEEQKPYLSDTRIMFTDFKCTKSNLR